MAVVRGTAGGSKGAAMGVAAATAPMGVLGARSREHAASEAKVRTGRRAVDRMLRMVNLHASRVPIKDGLDGVLVGALDHF